MSIERATELYATGLTANEEMRPVAGARALRAALRTLGPADGDTAEEHALRGRVMVSLAMAEAELGDLGAGLDLLRDADGVVEPERRGVVRAQTAILLRRAGRDAEAAVEYGRALALLDPVSQPALVAKVLVNRAVLLTAAVRLDAAAADLDRSLTLARQAGDDVVAAKVVHDQGWLAYVAGDLPTAMQRYDEVEGAYRRDLPGMLAMLRLDRARVLVAAGLVGEADLELDWAVGALAAQGSTQDAAEGLLARAEAALLDERPRDARRRATEARRLFGRRGNPRWVARAELVGLRADVAARTGARARGSRRDQDLAALATSLRVRLLALGMRDDARVAVVLAARAHVRAGRTDEARDLLSGPVPRGERLETVLLACAARAELAVADGRAAEAARVRRRGLATLHEARARLGALDLQGGAAVLGRELARAGLAAALADGTPSTLFTAAEQARAQVLRTRPARLGPEAGGAWQEFRALGVLLSQAELAGTPTDDLRRRRADLAARLRREAWAAHGSGVTDRQARLADVRRALGERALVELVADAGRLHALVVTRRGAQLVPLGPQAAAEEVSTRLRADLDAQAGGGLPESLASAVEAATRSDAAALAVQVVDPWLPLVGDREVVVVPVGGLLTVPWAALPGTAGRPLTVAPSATSWWRRTAEPAPAPDAPLLLVAGPATARGHDEVRRLAGLAADAGRPTVVLDGADATVEATLAALPHAQVVHVAAHGRHETGNSLFSGLELADGMLMGYDLLRLPRTPPVVVLSSCDLGLHESRPGDESVGLASALLATGARTVVASVTRAADEDAEAVTVEVHRGLSAGLAPASALAGATAGRTTGFVCFGAG